MNRMERKQRGSSTLGWLTTLLMVGLLATFLLKLGPVYMDDYALKKVVSSLDGTSDLDTTSVADVRTKIQKGLQTNLIVMQPNEIKVKRENGLVVVDINYERRLDFFYNIDLILTFEHDWKAINL